MFESSGIDLGFFAYPRKKVQSSKESGRFSGVKPLSLAVYPRSHHCLEPDPPESPALLVTASADKTARLWEASSGKAIGLPMQHNGEVKSAAFSPDGQRVVTASADKTARLWEASSGKAIWPAHAAQWRG